MEYMKIYEDFTKEEYRKALLKSFQSLRDGESVESVISYMNKYVDSNIKEITKLKTLVNKIKRTFSQYKYYFGSSSIGGRVVSNIHYILPDPKSESEKYLFYKMIEDSYNSIISNISNYESPKFKRINYLFERLLESTKVIIDNQKVIKSLGDKCYKLNDRKNAYELSGLGDAYSDFFKNDVNEIELVCKMILNEIDKLINS